MSKRWDAETAALVKRHYIDEGKSAAQVSRMLDGRLSRAAVVSGARARGWIKGEQPSMVRPVASFAAPVISETVKAGSDRWATRYPASPDAVGLLDLGFHTCRWPVGVPAAASEQRFCGHEAAKGPYCAAHRKRAFQRGTA